MMKYMESLYDFHIIQKNLLTVSLGSSEDNPQEWLYLEGGCELQMVAEVSTAGLDIEELQGCSTRSWTLSQQLYWQRDLVLVWKALIWSETIMVIFSFLSHYHDEIHNLYYIICYNMYTLYYEVRNPNQELWTNIALIFLNDTG